MWFINFFIFNRGKLLSQTYHLLNVYFQEKILKMNKMCRTIIWHVRVSTPEQTYSASFCQTFYKIGFKLKEMAKFEKFALCCNLQFLLSAMHCENLSQTYIECSDQQSQITKSKINITLLCIFCETF